MEKRIVEKPSGFISVALLQDRAGIGEVSPSSLKGTILENNELLSVAERNAQSRLSKHGTA